MMRWYIREMIQISNFSSILLNKLCYCSNRFSFEKSHEREWERNKNSFNYAEHSTYLSSFVQRLKYWYYRWKTHFDNNVSPFSIFLFNNWISNSEFYISPAIIDIFAKCQQRFITSTLEILRKLETMFI